ncbi:MULTISPECIES: DUF308 domain-containing protein [unclassified Romboutsia]|uniref:DUF308 domain-containing protein n=1 Tax=unclassified Romboutsia TaxID=2626894 RepID=UPI000F0463E0|nr:MULTISPECIES: DUF308 domain-containing protein [unclassified Romboutsia]
MFQFFNINLDGLNKRENATKFIALGLILIILGTLSLVSKGFGIKLVSWILGLSLLFIAYLNLKNINELSRYTPKEELKPYKQSQTILLILVVLLFLFPTKIQGFISSVIGAYLLVNQLLKFITNKNNPYFRFGLWNVIVIFFGITLIMSPLFLSRFISSIMSFIVLMIGLSLFAKGNSLR